MVEVAVLLAGRVAVGVAVGVPPKLTVGVGAWVRLEVTSSLMLGLAVKVISGVPDAVRLAETLSMTVKEFRELAVEVKR